MRLTDIEKQCIDNNPKMSSRKLAKMMWGCKSRKSSINDYRNRAKESISYNGPKILFFDIETAAILSHVWGLWQNNVGLNQIERDWFVLSWSAKWSHSDEIFYEDQRYSDDLENDTSLLESIWKMLDEADIVIGHNSRRFDTKKLNARFIMNGMKPPSHYRQIDTLEIAKRHFAFTSNKLQYLTDQLCTEHKKVTHQRFPGYELWKECLKGNLEAFDEMETYNKIDVLSLEELYYILAPWSNSLPNLNLYKQDMTCQCGSSNIVKNGYHYTNQSVFPRYRCEDCGHQTRGKENLLSADDRRKQRVNIV